MTAQYPATLTVSLPRHPIGVRLVRLVTESALGALAVEPECRDDIVVALTEACTNVVTHAHGSEQYQVTVMIADGVCRIEVADGGAGLPPDLATPKLPPTSAEAGRGLYLIAALSDRFEVMSKPKHGTTIRFAKRLTFR